MVVDKPYNTYFFIIHYILFKDLVHEQIWHQLQDLDDDSIEHVKLLYILQCISKSWKELIKDDNIWRLGLCNYASWIPMIN